MSRSLPLWFTFSRSRILMSVVSKGLSCLALTLLAKPAARKLCWLPGGECIVAVGDTLRLCDTVRSTRPGISLEVAICGFEVLLCLYQDILVYDSSNGCWRGVGVRCKYLQYGTGHCGVMSSPHFGGVESLATFFPAKTNLRPRRERSIRKWSAPYAPVSQGYPPRP
jgi:hypothetical protein